ncbi:SpoIIE family protein phosphatase [Streptomyces capparidis]
MNLTRWSARLPGTQRRGAAASRTDQRTAPSGVPAARGEQGARGPHPADGVSVHDVLGQVPALIAVTYGPAHRVGYVNGAYAEVFGPRGTGAPARDALPELAELGLLPLMDQVYRSGRPRTVKARRVTYAAPRGPGADQPGRRPDREGAEPRHGYFTFVCTPIRPGQHPGDALADVPLPPVPLDGDAPEPEPAEPPAEPPARRGLLRRRGPAGGRAADVRGVLVFGADVTDQVQAADRLRESERRHREAAVTLQRSLLPEELEQPDDLRVAAIYQPGGADTAVGGDWYDVITLGGGRTALVIGDVMGRGVRAAAVMGQLRTAVRAYARLDLPPHEVLQLLDGLAAEIDPNQIATCVYAVHDPNESRLVYASAGHLPVLIRDADGTARRGLEESGPPLGTGGWQHTSGSIALGPGATAVLYTDGLVERRGQDLDDGLGALTDALAGATGPPQVICNRLLRALGISADHDDDVAVLVLQLPAREGADAELFRNASLDLLGGVEAAPRARAFASGVLASWRFTDELRDLGVLAASELVANSLQHGTPPMRLRLRRTDRRLIIEVTDGDEHLPRRVRAEPADEKGRGISIVATIASNWGCRRTPDGGKAVWCEFALPQR